MLPLLDINYKGEMFLIYIPIDVENGHASLKFTKENLNMYNTCIGIKCLIYDVCIGIFIFNSGINKRIINISM